MTQNRNRQIKKLIGNIVNVIVHDILLEATNDENVKTWYKNEIKNSLTIANRCRATINPSDRNLSSEDQDILRTSIRREAVSALKLREQKKYKNLDFGKIEPTIEKYLKETNIV